MKLRSIILDSYEGLPEGDQFMPNAPSEIDALFNSLVNAGVVGRVYGPFDNYGVADDIHYFNDSDVEVTSEIMKHPAFLYHEAEQIFRAPWVIRIYTRIVGWHPDATDLDWILNFWPNEGWELITQ
jgi:hypothetical protein